MPSLTTLALLLVASSLRHPPAGGCLGLRASVDNAPQARATTVAACLGPRASPVSPEHSGGEHQCYVPRNTAPCHSIAPHTAAMPRLRPAEGL